MSHVLPTGRRLGISMMLALGTSLPALGGSPAFAQQGQSFTSAINMDIPRQSLLSALQAFSRRTGIQVVYTASIDAGITSAGISGDFDAMTALSRLLSGTGVTFRQSGRNAVVLTKSSANITLGPVRVGGTVAHQDPAGPGVGYVAENTMTGSKTDTPLIEIPNSIHVITRQQMTDQQPQNVMEALRYSPGVRVEALGSYANGVASGQNNGSIIQRGFATAQFVDGLRSYSNSAGETSFIDRIEVMNGPASVLYGQTTPGGMIGMSLKKPTSTPLHNVTLGFGNWGRYEATVDVSDKITQSGNVRYRVAAIGVTQGTQTNHIDYHRVGILPSITWDIDPRTNLTLVASYMYTPGDGTNPMQIPPEVLLNINHYGRIPRSRFLGDTNWNESGQKDAMIEYQFRHTFNRWLDFSQNLRWERNQSFAKELVIGAGMVTDELYSRRANNSSATNTNIGLDTRFGGKIPIGKVTNTWIVGSDFRDYFTNGGNMIDYTPGNNGFPGEDGYSIVNVYNPKSNYIPCMNIHSSQCDVYGYNSHDGYFQEGIYFQDQFKYKGLSIIAGGRQDWVDFHGYTDYQDNETADHSISYSRTSQLPRPQSAFTWRVGIVYEFDFGLAPYFSYSTSFVPQTGRNWKGVLFPPLTGKQLEAGLKYQSPDHNIFLQAAAFRINEDNYLVNDPLHENYSANAGQVRSQGFELSANANITRDLRFMASYTYDQAIYNKTNLSDTQEFADGTEGITISEKGKQIESVPRNMVSAFLDYTLPAQIFKGFGVNGGIRYTGSTFSDAVGSFKIPAYVLFDIGAHYDFGNASPLLKGLRAQLAISNLTNKYYVASCGGTYSCYLGQGRKVYGNLSYNW